MDPLTDLLGRARAAGSLFAQTTLHGRGGLALGAEPAPLALHVIRDGPLWLQAEGETTRLGPGDVVLVRGGTPVSFCAGPDEPATALAVLLADQVHEPGVNRLDIPGRAGRSVLLCGAYTLTGAICDQLLEVLPAVARVPASSGPLARVVEVLHDELDAVAPGQQTALDRLLDLLLVHVLRAHFASGATAPAWYVALQDPVVGKALRAVHGDPAAAWTVELLARTVGLSRAAFARRFTAAVGEPPVAYLTGWRIALAKEALHRDGSTLASVAREVGYASEFALSAAFRRTVGEPPGRWRERTRAG
ncbi:MAG: AraC family transcriptional regulator [Nocardioides sp.]|nr:AraC family transcriptional regulator [Nocardioides sp.]